MARLKSLEAVLILNNYHKDASYFKSDSKNIILIFNLPYMNKLNKLSYQLKVNFIKNRQNRHNLKSFFLRVF